MRHMSSAPSSSIGFIGLGNMGAHMARNLLKAGHKVVVYDLNAAAIDSLKQSGAEVCSPFLTLAATASLIPDHSTHCLPVRRAHVSSSDRFFPPSWHG
jgi:UDP-N-acetyl-D-mannosaminuronate dehydrogenase